jgi:hypothetical protein
MITIQITRTQEQMLNRYVSEHLEKCYDFLYNEENGIVSEDDFSTFAPFCGCQDCVQREMLHACFEFLEKSSILKLDAVIE